MWAIGDKVVCVDANNGHNFPVLASVLVEDKIYVIEDVITPNLTQGVCGLILVGVKGRARERLLHKSGTLKRFGGYRETRFRKVLPDKHEPCSENFRLTLKGKVGL